MSQTSLKEQRNKFLLEVYNACKGSTAKYTTLNDVGENAGLNEEQSDDIASYWHDSGNIKILTKDGVIQLTSAGIDKVEQEFINEHEHLLDNEGFTNEEINELHKKIDVVLDKLERLGKGQEIIFDEIDELKQKGKGNVSLNL